MHIDISKHLPDLFEVKRILNLRQKDKWNEYKWDYDIIVFFNLLGSTKLCPIQIWPPSTTRMADNAWLGKNVPALSESLEVRDANAKETSQPRRGSCCLQTELHKVSRHY